jgi:hypothetical protein
LIEVETKFPFANSISEFSRSQDPERTSVRRLLTHALNSHVADAISVLVAEN